MWQKKGLIYVCDILGTGYAQDPFIDILNKDIWRIYFSSRTKDVVSLPFFMDVEAGNPRNIIRVNKKPLFMPGYPGTFDDNGITMTSIVNMGDCKYIYYCGWNKGGSVPYSLSIGLAIAVGDNYEKKFDGPVMDKSIYDPICVSAPFVMRDGSAFRMWYISFTEWKKYNDRMEPTFIIKTAYSYDGINWTLVHKPCFKSEYRGESFARPWVVKEGGLYKMWFSVRGPEGYRSKSGQHYMIGYAESNNGENFKRMPVDITTSDKGWDSEMMEYASVIRYNGYYHMFYNGNDFGKTGFGYAIKGYGE